MFVQRLLIEEGEDDGKKHDEMVMRYIDEEFLLEFLKKHIDIDFKIKEIKVEEPVCSTIFNGYKKVGEDYDSDEDSMCDVTNVSFPVFEENEYRITKVNFYRREIVGYMDIFVLIEGNDGEEIRIIIEMKPSLVNDKGKGDLGVVIRQMIKYSYYGDSENLFVVTQEDITQEEIALFKKAGIVLCKDEVKDNEKSKDCDSSVQ